MLVNMVGVINYGQGNVASVRNAVEYIGRDVREVGCAAEMEDISHFILPGVGAFASAMEHLTKLDLIEALRRQVIEKGKWLLGICVGMQVFGRVGHEFGSHPGLGYIEGSVDPIAAPEHGLPVPHMGWNELELRRESALLSGMPERPCFYFVHSYQLNPTDQRAIMATCDYGSPVVACVERDNVLGVQFHPEKSQRDGLQLLRNFCGLK
jgi:glutamine amidotransferase